MLGKWQNLERGGGQLTLISCGILLACLIAVLVWVQPAHALDFSSCSGLADIWYIDRLPNGNIVALDSSGRAAVFDYLNWTIIHDSLGFVFHAYAVDPNAGCVLATKNVSSYSQGKAVPYKYDIVNNTWSVAGPTLSNDTYVRVIPYFFSRNGEIYGVYHTGDDENKGIVKLFKLNEGKWVLVLQGPEVQYPLEGRTCCWAYDPYGDKLVLAYLDAGGPSWKLRSLQYQFSNGAWSEFIPSSYSRWPLSVGSFKNISAYAYCVTQSGPDPYGVYIGGNTFSAGTTDNGVEPALFITKDFLSAKWYSGVYLNNGSGTLTVNLGYPLNVACYDKFGNIVMGGPNGKVIVRDKGGVIRTDTSFYSEFVIHDAKALAEEAASAAQAAEAASIQAKNLAQEAKNNTVYQGQSAAYWAYQAAQAANTPPVITKIQGLNGATCTRGTNFTLVVTASDNGPPSNLRYRAVCGSFDSGWLSTNQITITGLSAPGPKTAAVMVSDNPTNPDGGNIAQSTFTFFKI